jgi:hypothetical protein
MEEFECECGRVFKSKSSRNSHYRFCKVHKPKQKYDEDGKYISSSKYKVNDKYICECGREFNNNQSLNVHFSHCDFHHECRGTIRKGHKSELTKSMCWDKKTEDEIKKIHLKSRQSYSKAIKNGEIKPSFLGKKHKPETINKIRKSTVKYLSNLYGGNFARYSIKACRYIDSINKKYGWNLQHAENGGEIQIDGYFLDGYDKDLNIVFEYDERKHYKDVQNNILSDKDIKRQQYIMNKLGCRFFRYNEDIDKLYEVMQNTAG